MTSKTRSMLTARFHVSLVLWKNYSPLTNFSHQRTNYLHRDKTILDSSAVVALITHPGGLAAPPNGDDCCPKPLVLPNPGEPNVLGCGWPKGVDAGWAAPAIEPNVAVSDEPARDPNEAIFSPALLPNPELCAAAPVLRYKCTREIDKTVETVV